MIYLVLAIASSAMIAVIMRISSRTVRGNISMLAMNYLTCLLLGAWYAGFQLLPVRSPEFPVTVGMGVINGALYLAGFVLLQHNIRTNGVVLSATFIKLGLLVSMVVSVVFFGERPAIWQWAGFLLAVAAIVLMNYRPGEAAAGNLAGLFFLLLAGGGGDAMSKIFEELGNPALSGHFLMITFLVAMALCMGLCRSKKEKPGKWEVAFGLLIGIPNFFSAKFLLGALEDIAAVIVYPVYSVATILTVTVTGILVFREKLEKRQWVALAMILVALVLLNI